MYKDFFGLARYPFENSPDPDFFYVSPSHREALQWLTYGIQERKGALVLTGDVGCGKTVLSRKIVLELPGDAYDVAVVVNPSLSPVDLLREILFQLEIPRIPKSKVEILHELNGALLNAYKAGRHVVIVIDEAQAIRNAATLEELRLLLNFQRNDGYLLTLLLIGQPEWAERLHVLPQLEQRVAVHYVVRPLGAVETAGYVRHRLTTAGGDGTIFDPGALAAVYRLTNGIPRRVNALCDRALLAAFQQSARAVDEALIERISAR